MTKRFSALLLPLAGLVMFAMAGMATAQSADLDIRIREVSFGSDGSTDVTVSLSGAALGAGALPSSAFSVTEQGQPITGVTASALSASAARGVAVVVVIDSTGTTLGAPIAAAKASAKTFVSALPATVRIGLLTFGETARVIVPLTTDRATVNRGIDAVAGSRERTALYDGVIAAAKLLEGAANAQHNIVVFSDGQDNASRSTLSQAVDEVRKVEAPVSAVLLKTRGTDEAALNALADAQSGGRFLSVLQTAGLRDAFARLAQSINSQYVLTYARGSGVSGDLEIAVTATAGGATARDESVVLNERIDVPVDGGIDKPLIGFFAGSLGLWVGMAAVFAGALVFLGMLFYRPAGKTAERMLARGLKMYSRSERTQKRQPSGSESGMASTAVGRRAIGMVERVPRSEKFEEKMQKQLEQAGWPMRSTEFVIFQLGGAVGGALIGFGLLQRAWLGLVLMVVGAIVPQLMLTSRITKRSAEFLSQLPDTLQLLAGSLQAGYGFMQAIDTVAKEANAPTGPEFARVLSEARLGMPLEDALDGMAERLGGVDFKWVVLAINIQRQVGGNLATLLQTIANTLREREQVRRQIKVLSAEGRLSAVILVALPFVLAGYISVVNPKYIGELTGASLGRILIAVAMVLMGLGIVWMRKIIKIDV